jgi:hypothetical protein
MSTSERLARVLCRSALDLTRIVGVITFRPRDSRDRLTEAATPTSGHETSARELSEGLGSLDLGRGVGPRFPPRPHNVSEPIGQPRLAVKQPRRARGDAPLGSRVRALQLAPLVTPPDAGHLGPERIP